MDSVVIENSTFSRSTAGTFGAALSVAARVETVSLLNVTVTECNVLSRGVEVISPYTDT